MKGLIIGLLIYFSGSVATYKLGKYDISIRKHYAWTVGDRTLVLFLSCMSWVSFMGIGAAIILDATNTDAPASW